MVNSVGRSIGIEVSDGREEKMNDLEKAREIADSLETRVRNIVGGRNLEAEGITKEDGYGENSFPAVSWPKRWLVEKIYDAIKAEREACVVVARQWMKENWIGPCHEAIRGRNKGE